MGKPISTRARGKAIRALAQGHSVPEAAQAADCCPATVRRLKKDPTVREQVANLQRQLLEGAGQALVDGYKDVILKGRDKIASGAIEDAPQLARLYAAVSKSVGQSVGILPTPTPSIFVQNNILQGPGSTILGASANGLIAKMVEAGQGYGQMLIDDDDDCIDVEAIDVWVDED